MRIGKEIDLLKNYPKAPRKIEERAAEKTKEDREIARKFDYDFFDGDRRHGYGGFSYQPRFWQPVVPTFRDYFQLTPESSVLDVGCAKAFMMHDLAKLVPGINVKGIDISKYAIQHALPDMKEHVQVENATSLPFPDNSFDIVISINTIHNLARDDCQTALKEIERVSRRGSYVTVDAYRNTEEKESMYAWNLTAQTIMHVDEWKSFFDQAGYTGDFFWFIP